MFCSDLSLFGPGSRPPRSFTISLPLSWNQVCKVLTFAVAPLAVGLRRLSVLAITKRNEYGSTGYIVHAVVRPSQQPAPGSYASNWKKIFVQIPRCLGGPSLFLTLTMRATFTVHWQHHYNIRMFFDICRGSIFPAILVASVIFYTDIRIGYQAIPLYIFFVLVCAAMRILFSEVIHHREANRLRAKPIPRVIGKWPGNVDVFLKMLRSARTSYLVNSYLELFEEYQATTLNLRILWVDQVRFRSFPRSDLRSKLLRVLSRLSQWIETTRNLF